MSKSTKSRKKGRTNESAAKSDGELKEENQKKENTGMSNNEDSKTKLVSGIDLGTQNTAALFLDEDEEEVSVQELSSIVGFPKNELSRQKLKEVLGRPVAFDDEVYSDGIAQNLDLRWPLKTVDTEYGDEGVQSLSEEDKQTLNMVVKRVLDLDIIRERDGDETKYIQLAIATPSVTALHYNQELIGFVRRNLPDWIRPAFLVESEAHFAGYGLSRKSEDLAKNGVIIVDVGAGTKDFHVYDGNPSDQQNMISFPEAGNAVTERLFQYLQEEGYQNTWQEVESIKKEYGRFDAEAHTEVYKEPELIVDELRYHGRSGVRADIGPEMQKAYRPLLEDLVDGFKQLLERYQGPVPETVALVGLQGQTPGLKEALEHSLNDEQFDVKVRNLSDFDVKHPNTFVAKGALKRIQATPYKQLSH